MSNLLNFKYGAFGSLPTAKAPGTVYVTTDEQAMYIDLPNATNSATIDRIRIGDIIVKDNARTAKPPFSDGAFYYFVEENALLRWTKSENGGFWTQINSVADVEASITSLTAQVENISGKLDNEIARSTGVDKTHSEDIAQLKTDVGNRVTTTDFEEFKTLNKQAIDQVASAAATADAKAVTAQQTAEAALANAATADDKAQAAQQAAEAAQETANTALENANTADDKAEAAQSTADIALANAATADGKAVAAQQVAEAADAKAVTANTKAETADGKAEAAQDTADAAQQAAATADGKAVTAQQTANAAQQAAENADAKAAAAQTSADTANSGIDTINSTALFTNKENQTMGESFSMGSNKITQLAGPDNDQDAATKKYVDDAVENAKATMDAMTFKGVVDCGSDGANTEAPANQNANKGDVWKVGRRGIYAKTSNYAGIDAKAGDLLIYEGDDGTNVPGKWAHVTSGYEDDYLQKFFVKSKAPTENNDNGGIVLHLSNGIGDPTENNSISNVTLLGSHQSNLHFNVEMKNNFPVITASMIWGTF